MTPREHLARVLWRAHFPHTPAAMFDSDPEVAARYFRDVDALLLALREPTDEQLEVGAAIWVDYLLVRMKNDPDAAVLTEAWQAMIDVLREGS